MKQSILVAAITLASAGFGGRSRDRAGADLHQGRRADPLQELHELPSAGRDRADVAADLTRTRVRGRSRSRTQVAQGHDAAVARRSRVRRVPQRSPPERRRQGHARSRGSTPARPEGNPDGSARAADLRRAAGRSASPTPCSDAGGLSDSGDGHDRVSVLRSADEPHRRQAGSRRWKCGPAIAPSCTT